MEKDESRVKLECILHTDAKRGSKDEKIKPFTGETWIKVQTAARARLRLIKSSKYDVICRNLSSSFQSNDGYHYSCYKKEQVGKDQEKAQSEKDSHSKNRGGKKPN